MWREYDIACGWHLRRFSLLNEHFAFIDTTEYLADSLFIKHEVPVVFGHEYQKADTPYRIIFCKCRKRDVPRFLKALKELPKKMAICGHADYSMFCSEVKQAAENNIVQTKRGVYHNTGDPIKETE